jgi:nucleoside phosphorylase
LRELARIYAVVFNKREDSVGVAQEEDEPVEVVILTVIPIELEAALRVLRIEPDHRAKDLSGTIYYRGVMHSERAQRGYAIALTCMGIAGNPTAAAATARAIAKYHPRIVILMGIAAGVRGKVKIGEVVLSERVVAYEPAALVESENGMKEEPRPDIDRVSHTILQDLASYGRPDSARLEETFRRAGGVIPTATAGHEAEFDAHVASGIHAHQGTIASGEKLLRAPEKLLQLRELHGKIEAAEMEAAGVVDGCRPGAVPWLIIRGISDFGDSLKDNRFHAFAAWAAAAVLYDFILYGLELGTPPPFGAQRHSSAHPPSVGRPLLGFGRTLDPEADIADHEAQHQKPNVGDNGQPDQLRREAATQAITNEEIVEAFRQASSALLRWPQTLRAIGEWVERPELKKIAEHMLEKKGALVLLGAPGSGKSALLARASAELHAKGAAVLAIKADRLPHEIDSREKLARELGLPADLDPVGALRASVAVRPTVLVIDQLDALGDLVDEQTERLTLLLELVEELVRDPAIAIVMSCRTVDFSHDVRFRRLAAEQLTLQPPSAAELDRVLQAAGIDPAKLPPRLKEVLGTIQALDAFLQLAPLEKRGLMETHQQLLAILWRQRMGQTSEAKVLETAARRLAMMMADREELWLAWPVIEEEDLESPVSTLIERGLLVEEGQRVAFAHQTLFDFARARAFLSTPSLVEYVRRKQGALYVRPTLWTTLAYLRSMDPQRYIAELEELWSDPSVRMHIHTLLVEFVGQVADPRDREVALLVSQLSDDVWRPVAIQAVVGRPAWFSILHEVHFPALLRGSHAAMMTRTLIHALDFSPEATLDLIETYWVGDPTKYPFIANVVTYAKSWSERLRNLVLMVSRAGTLDRPAIRAMLHTAIEVDPTFAPKLIVEELSRRRDAIEDEDRREAYKDLLAYSDGLDCLVDAAVAAPREFFAELWPWVVNMIERIRYPGTSVRYGEDYCHGMSFGHGSGELARALRESIAGWAATDSDGVARFVSTWQDRDSVTLQRFLIMVLEAGLPLTRTTALAYLLGDERRLNVGDTSDMDRYSVRLVQRLAPLLDEAEVEQLRSTMANARAIDPRDCDPADQSSIATYNQRHQLWLLRALGKERLPDEIRTAIGDLEQEVHDEDASGRRASIVESPLSSAELLLMSDDEILCVFAELPSTAGLRLPGTDLVWSGIELSREFAKAAKQEPERFLSLLSRFVPGVAESPVGMALRALAEVVPLQRIEDVVVALHEREFFRTQEQQRHAAYALETAAHGKAEISERVLALLESWLIDKQGADHGELQASARGPSEPHSLLWTSSGGGGLPGGNYPILHALTEGYLGRAEPRVEPWLGVLERHLERRERRSVWLAMTIFLGNVLHAPRERAEVFLDRLFARFPGVRETHDGLVIIAHAMHRMPGEMITRWLEDLEGGTWPQRHQAFGELLVLFATRRDAPLWSHDRLEHELTRFESSCSDTTGIMVGIAFAAANLWARPERRAAATEILTRVIRAASGTVAQAVMDAFHNERTLLNDEETGRVLAALTSAPAVIASGRGLSFLDDLQHLLPANAVEIAELLIALASYLQTQTDRSYLMSHGSELVDLAMTLQRLRSPIRERGLDLFEQLLAMGVYETFEVLSELDPAERHGPLRPPRSRRPRHRRRAARPA